MPITASGLPSRIIFDICKDILHGLRAAIKAMEDIFANIKNNGGIYDLDGFIDPVSHVFEIQGVQEMKENEKIFLR